MSPLARELDTPPARSRRSLLGAAGSSVTLAASGLLLPASLAAAPAEVDAPLRDMQNRAGKRRHRRQKHRRKHETQAYTTAVLTGPQVIPSNALTTIGFDTFLIVRDLTYELSESRVAVHTTGTYSMNVFLSWSGSSAGRWITHLVVTHEGSPSNAYDYVGLLTTEPQPTVFTAIINLKKGDTLQMISQQDSATEALVSAGTMVITLL